jgi:o-succinylbenzoate---CoA ligase
MSIKPSDHVFLTDGVNTIRYSDLNSIFARWIHIPQIQDLRVQLELETKSDAISDEKTGGNPKKTRNCIAFIAGRGRVEPLLIAFSWYTGIPLLPLPVMATLPEYRHYIDTVTPSVLVLPEHDHPLSTLAKTDYKQITLMSDSVLEVEIDTQPDEHPSIPWFTETHEEIGLLGYFFTSGSSGKPKCVPVRRRQVIAAWKASISNVGLNPGDLWLHTLPLNHIGGTSILTRSLLSGSGVYWSNQSSAAAIARILSSHNAVVSVSLVPTQLKRLLESGNINLSNRFKAVLLGGGPAESELIENAKRLGLPVIPSFGMTETAAQCLAVPLTDWQFAPPGTCGKPLPGIEVRIDSWDNDKLPIPDKTGLLWVRGAQVFDGYLNEKRNDTDFGKYGWFCTGDYARIDKNGYVFIEMRRSDRIVSGGENVNPLEVEQAIAALHLIAGDFAVFALPDSQWGQAVVLAVTTPAATQIFTSEKLRHALSTKLSAFKIPKRIVTVESIPRTETGKVKRFELTAMFSD